MFCPKCGTPVSGGTACPACGAALAPQSPAQPQQQQPYGQPRPYWQQQQPQPYQPQQQPYQPQPQPYQPQQQPYGQPPQPQFTPQYQQPQYGRQGYPQTPKKKRTGLIVGLSIGAVAIAAFLVVLFAVIIPANTDEGKIKSVIKNVESALNTNNFEKMYSCYPPGTDRDDVEWSWEDLKEYITDCFGDDITGDSYSVSFKTGVIMFYEDKTNAVADITIVVTRTTSGSSVKYTEDSKLSLVRIGGKWYIVL